MPEKFQALEVNAWRQAKCLFPHPARGFHHVILKQTIVIFIMMLNDLSLTVWGITSPA